jgi:hypothetical protein
VADETVTSRDRIREAIERYVEEHALAVTAGTATGPLVVPLVAEGLVRSIDEALFGPPPGRWIGPQVTAEEWAALLRHDLWTEAERTALIRHIEAMWATIRNQNAEMDDQRRRLRELDALRAEVPLTLYLTGLNEVMGRGLMAERVPVIAALLRRVRDELLREEESADG